MVWTVAEERAETLARVARWGCGTAAMEAEVMMVVVIVAMARKGASGGAAKTDAEAAMAMETPMAMMRVVVAVAKLVAVRVVAALEMTTKEVVLPVIAMAAMWRAVMAMAVAVMHMA